jgi:hypothetical protein
MDMEHKMTRLIIDGQTQQETVEELSKADLADLAKANKDYEAREADKLAKAAAKAALLERLGITADEAALLLS